MHFFSGQIGSIVFVWRKFVLSSMSASLLGWGFEKLLSLTFVWRKFIFVTLASFPGIGIWQLTKVVIWNILSCYWQGMKLLPTGRKNSLAIFMYSSAVGINLNSTHFPAFIFLDGKDGLNKIFLTGWFGIFPPPILTWIVPFNTYGDGNQWRHVLSCMSVNMLRGENNFRVFHLDPSFFMLFFCMLKRPCFSRTHEWLFGKLRIFWPLCIFLVYRR